MAEERKTSNPERPPTTGDVPLLVAEDHLKHLLVEPGRGAVLVSLVRNVKEALFPPKLPPLQVTSKPVAVQNIWGLYGYKKRSGFTSLAIHAAVVTLAFTLATNKSVQLAVKQSVILFDPDLAPYLPQPQKPKQMGGGGGGGDRSPLPASKGKLPKLAPRQFTPPMAVVNNPNPKLIMEPTLIIAPDINLPNVNMAQLWRPAGQDRAALQRTGLGRRHRLGQRAEASDRAADRALDRAAEGDSGEALIAPAAACLAPVPLFKAGSGVLRRSAGRPSTRAASCSTSKSTNAAWCRIRA